MYYFWQLGGLILVPYEFAMLGSLYISLYSHLQCISDFVSTCGFIPEIVLATFEMHINFIEFSLQRSVHKCHQKEQSSASRDQLRP